MGEIADYYIEQMMFPHDKWHGKRSLHRQRTPCHQDKVLMAKNHELVNNQQERVMRDLSLDSVLRRVRENKES